MEKIIKIGDKEVTMRATAATPLHYRNQFNKDLIVELSMMEGKELVDLDFGVFERMAYIMSGAFKDGTSLEDWLEQFDSMTDIIEASAEMIELWEQNAETRLQGHSKNAEMVENSTQA